MEIELTQCIMPDGRREQVTCEIIDELKEQVDFIRECGCEFTCEVLSTGMVATYISLDGNNGDFDMRVTANNEKVIQSLEEMIAKFTLDRFSKWKANLEEDE